MYDDPTEDDDYCPYCAEPFRPEQPDSHRRCRLIDQPEKD